jgi:ABC-2 type transport system ATP-binding protein
MSSLISLTDITKTYRNTLALNRVSVDVQPGITGLLGPNGAGKSTLIKLILGLVKMTSGSGTVLGYRLGSEGRRIRSKIGYMPEDDCFIAGLSGVEVVQFTACLAGLPPTEALRRSHEILDFCGMKQERYRKVDTYSTGMRQKIKFASAIVHDPEFLILDEPTSGLDPEEREALLNRIKLLSQQVNKSVLISTHILPDVQAICDNVLILSAGQVLLTDSLANLNRTSSPSVSFRVYGDHQPILQYLERSGFKVNFTFDRQVIVEGNSDDIVAQVWSAAHQTNSKIQTLVPAKNSLEEIFLATVREAAHAIT